MAKKGTVTIDFGSDRAADHFIDWLSGAGEQHYWDWMDAREYEEQGPITAIRFDYMGYIPQPSGGWRIEAELGRQTD